MTKRPTALGVHIFAGGFTVGMKRHLDVLAHLEASQYGVATVRQNHPGLEVRVDKAMRWQAEDFAGRVDVIYGNPPCSPWSLAGVKTRGVQARDYSAGYDPRDQRVAYLLAAFDLLGRVQPKILALESVTQLFVQGRRFVDHLAAQAALQGYGTDVVLLDGYDCGVPQHRKRVFIVFTRLAIDWRRPAEPGPRTVGEALAPIVLDNSAVAEVCQNELNLLKQTPPGRHLRDTYHLLYGESRLGEKRPGEYGGRPGFLKRRLDPEKPAPAFLGGATYFHPTALRHVSVLESQVLCGYPHDYVFAGNARLQYMQVAQAVMPPVGAWLGRVLARAVVEARPRPAAGLKLYDYLHKDAYQKEIDMTTDGSNGSNGSNEQFSWLQVGAEVDYHAVIGGPVTKPKLKVRIPPEVLPNGQAVVWLDGISGCVAVEAVSPPFIDVPQPAAPTLDTRTVIDARLAKVITARRWLDHRKADEAAQTCEEALNALERELQTAARVFNCPTDPAAPRVAVAAPVSVPAGTLSATAPGSAAALAPAPAFAPPAVPAAPAAPKPKKPQPPAPELPPPNPAIVAKFTPRLPDGNVKPRAMAEMFRAMVMDGSHTDLEMAAAAKSVYPDVTGPVHKYPYETRQRLKRAGQNPPPAKVA